METIGNAGNVRRRIAAIGMFDGVHVGHSFLIDFLKGEAEARNLSPAVVTFYEHPLSIVRPAETPKRLSTPQERAQLLGIAGIGDVIMLHFDEALRSMTARQFMELMHDRYGIDALVMGFNNRFGHDRLQTMDQYRETGRQTGIEVIEAPEYEGPHAPVSSSIIRSLIGDGRMAEASAKLGRPYLLTGPVVTGNQIGRKLGFPTANIDIDDSLTLLPREGVYAALATTPDGATHRAMLNIGHRPTINSDAPTRLSVEAHLHDYSGNLYGSTISVEPLEMIRHECRFPTLEKLKSQLAIDARATKAIASARLASAKR